MWPVSTATIVSPTLTMFSLYKGGQRSPLPAGCLYTHIPFICSISNISKMRDYSFQGVIYSILKIESFSSRSKSSSQLTWFELFRSSRHSHFPPLSQVSELSWRKGPDEAGPHGRHIPWRHTGRPVAEQIEGLTEGSRHIALSKIQSY